MRACGLVMTRMKRIRLYNHRLSFSSLTTAVFLYLSILCVTLIHPCHSNINTDPHRRIPIPLWRNLVGNRQNSPPKRPRHDLKRQKSRQSSSGRGWRFWRRKSTNTKNELTRKKSTRQDEPESGKEEEADELTQVPGNMLPHGIFRGVRDRMNRGDSSSAIGAQDDALIPLVYRYYGRNRARTHTAGSIPFLLLGPNVDHWKVIGQQLAAKGFSVMTCEQVQDDNVDEASSVASSSSSLSPLQVQIRRHSRVTRTLLTLLDALRWNRVVLVACDAESALAVEAALELAPDRVVGLVLCGNLDSIEPLINLYNSNNRGGSMSPLRATGDTPTGTFHVDRFLKRHLKCPFTVVWGGDDTPIIDDDDDNKNFASNTVISTPASDSCGIDDAVKAARRVILGAGSAPHRRRPEMFSWVLTRFVEEEIATLPPPSIRQSPAMQAPMSSKSKDGKSEKDSTKDRDTQPASTVTNTPVRRSSGLHLPFELQEFFSSQSFVVLGRIVAAALFYGMALRVGFYQYETLGANIRSWLRAPGNWRRKVVGVLHIRGIWSFIRDKGVMPILSCLKRVTRGILFFVHFTKDESQTKQPQMTGNQEMKKPEDDEIEPLRDDSNAEKTKARPEPTAPPSEGDEKSNDDENENGGDDDQEEAKPGFKPFFLLDRVIA